jgi:hypothetical protein
LKQEAYLKQVQQESEALQLKNRQNLLEEEMEELA